MTGPQYLLGQGGARRRLLERVFNGEGGDQLFGGWTSKPMISAELYADLYDEDSREELYLRSYHRFYGLEDQLYTPQFRAQVGGPGQRRALLAPYLRRRPGHYVSQPRAPGRHLPQRLAEHPAAGRARWPTARARPTRAAVRPALAEASFRLPPQLKLHGAAEKYILKLVLQRHLPREIVWRRKYGMSVPITDWVLGPLAPADREPART